MEGPPGFHFQVEIEYNTAVRRQVNNLDEALARLAETIFQLGPVRFMVFLLVFMDFKGCLISHRSRRPKRVNSVLERLSRPMCAKS